MSEGEAKVCRMGTGGFMADGLGGGWEEEGRGGKSSWEDTSNGADSSTWLLEKEEGGIIPMGEGLGVGFSGQRRQACWD